MLCHSVYHVAKKAAMREEQESSPEITTTIVVGKKITAKLKRIQTSIMKNKYICIKDTHIH